MRAIAAAARVPFDDILVLNCRSEIGLTGGLVDGCSAIAYKDPSTGRQLVAQNWDWHSNQLGNTVVLDITHLDGTRVITITEAGIVGKIGFNSNGVGVTLNAIKTKGVPLDYSMLPIHFALRYIVLESPNARQAIDQLRAIGVASTAHFLIADNITASGVEVCPLGDGIIAPDPSGYILHTNHWISSPERVSPEIWLPDTYTRLERLEALKCSVRSAEDIWEVLSDETDFPGSICRAVGTGRGSDDDLETLFGVVMDLHMGVAELVHGRPTKGKPRVVLPRSGPLRQETADWQSRAETG